MFQTLHEISKNLIFVFVWKYVWKYVNINVSDIKKKKKKNPPANAGDTGSSPGPGRSYMPRSN